MKQNPDRKPRCEKGKRRDLSTGECIPKKENKENKTPDRKPRCEKGKRRDLSTGECIPKEKKENKTPDKKNNEQLTKKLKELKKIDKSIESLENHLHVCKIFYQNPKEVLKKFKKPKKKEDVTMLCDQLETTFYRSLEQKQKIKKTIQDIKKGNFKKPEKKKNLKVKFNKNVTYI
jgi:hypothetical protein